MASDPFADSHEAQSVLCGVDTNNLSHVDLETYESEATGGLLSILVRIPWSADFIFRQGRPRCVT